MSTLPLEDRKKRKKATEQAYAQGWPPYGRTIKGKAGALSIAGKSLGVGAKSMRDWFLSEKALAEKGEKNYLPDEDKYVPDSKKPGRILSEADVLRREITNLKREWGNQLEEAHKQIELMEAVTPLFQRTPQPPKWTSKASRKTQALPVLFGSDRQFGEVIDADEMDGINAYNLQIAEERLQLFFDKGIRLITEHSGYNDFPGVVYLRGGDEVSGDIHQELRETNALGGLAAMDALVDLECAGIEKLADEFGKVHVKSVPGNHGRTTIKPHSKKYAELNYDYILAKQIERFFRDDKRVSFQTPVSGDALFDLFGWTCLLTHGDRIGSRGGQGFVGPAATVARGFKKVADYQSQINRRVDFIFCGHFHTPLALEQGWCNGSVPGINEFARDNRMRPHPAQQWLFLFDEDYGVIDEKRIYLEKPRKEDRKTVTITDITWKASGGN